MAAKMEEAVAVEAAVETTEGLVLATSVEEEEEERERDTCCNYYCCC